MTLERRTCLRDNAQHCLHYEIRIRCFQNARGNKNVQDVSRSWTKTRAIMILYCH
ncbi:hypothetical protein M3J09_009515 [Ascochyta lentis]